MGGGMEIYVQAGFARWGAEKRLDFKVNCCPFAPGQTNQIDDRRLFDSSVAPLYPFHPVILIPYNLRSTSYNVHIVHQVLTAWLKSAHQISP